MKALSLLQPWASLVVLGHKKVETRSWNTKYRGELLIHASAGKKVAKEIIYRHPFDEVLSNHFDWFMPDVNDLPFGAIIGKVNLIDTFPTEEVSHNCNFHIGKNTWEMNDQELAFGDYSEGRYCWLLSDPVIFNPPVPAKGSLSIWNYDNPLPILL